MRDRERLADLLEREVAPDLHHDDVAEFRGKLLHGIAQDHGLFIVLENGVEPHVLEIIEVDHRLLAFPAAGFAAVVVETAEADCLEHQRQVGWSASFVALMMPHPQDGVLHQVLGVLARGGPAASEQQQTRTVLGQPLFPRLRGILHGLH